MNPPDIRLLEFESYSNYLESFVTADDLRYLPSAKYARFVAELGYHSKTKILSKDEFERKKALVKEMLNPLRNQQILFSKEIEISDPVLQELAKCEKLNLDKELSTIIYLRHKTKKGVEISGYIDFEWSLKNARNRKENCIDWEAVFKGNKHLWPTVNDLGFYNWKTGISVSNNSDNYKFLCDPVRGLIFINQHDGEEISPDPTLPSPGTNTTRTLILDSPNYSHCVLYDHVLKK
uniref:Cilia- and flagella-associated protein 299 n=1 Tax=Culicoides sonorensis TaxID=179676 RepID=A0A336KQS2_CULSO